MENFWRRSCDRYRHRPRETNKCQHDDQHVHHDAHALTFTRATPSPACTPLHSRRRLEVGVDHVGPGEVAVVVRGGLDVTTAGTLRAAITALLNRGGVDTIGLDLRQVDLLDPAAVGTLVAAQRICHDMGVQLRVTAAGPVRARILAAATAT